MKLVQDCKFTQILVPCILYGIICYIILKLFAINLSEEKMGMCIFATLFYVIISMILTAFSYVVVTIFQEESNNIQKEFKEFK